MFLSVKIFPDKLAAFPDHVSMPAVFLGQSTPIRDSYRCTDSLFVYSALRHMSMSVQQNISGMQRRQFLFVIDMSMGGIDCRLPFRKSHSNPLSTGNSSTI